MTFKEEAALVEFDPRSHALVGASGHPRVHAADEVTGKLSMHSRVYLGVF